MDDLNAFRQALEGLRAEMEQVKADREQAMDLVDTCERRLEQIQVEYDGIESWLRRHAQPEQQEAKEAEDQPAAEAPEEAPADGWAINRVEAVARVLREATEPLSPGIIVELLSRVGRSDDMKDVAAALSHLKKRGRATNVSRGMWVHA